MRFARRVAAGFAGLMLVTVAIAALAIVVLAVSVRRGSELIGKYAEDVMLVERLRLSAEQTVAAGRGYILHGEESYKQKLVVARGLFDDMIADLRERAGTSVGLSLLDEVKRAGHAHEAALDRVIERRGTTADPRLLVPEIDDEVQPRRGALQAALRTYVEYKRGQLDGALRDSASSAYRAMGVLVVGVLLGLMLSTILAVRVTRRLGLLYAREQEALCRARDAVRNRDDILAIVSHDLRNPLGVIMTRAQALVGRSRDDEVASRNGAAIQKAAAQMERLVRDLQDAKSIEEGQLSLGASPSRVAALFAAARDLFEEAAARKSIGLVFEQDDDRHVFADRERIVQVLSNLIGNALKFTPKGGRVTVRAEATHPGDVCFEVRDTGPGIAAELRPHLFDRYHSGGTVGSGLGLGLYIAKGIVEAHGGRLWSAPSNGRGSRFLFTLRRAERPSPLAEEAAQPAPPT